MENEAVKNKIENFSFFIIIFLIVPVCTYSQSAGSSDSIDIFSLDQCINYALQHQPALNQAIINQAITKITNKIDLSGWLPQVNLSGNMLHYNQLPTAFITNQITPGGPPVKTHTGVINTAIPVLSVSQELFNPQLVHAAKIAPLYLIQAEQITDSTKINIIAGVSKSFYNLLLTLEQINILKEDTTRLGRNVTDAYHQYIGGIVDRTDYDQAVITLNNSLAQLKLQLENVSPQYAGLKQLMGYPPDKQFNVVFDTIKMMQKIAFDTTQLLQYEKRIEYRQLQTEKKLQHQLTVYGKLTYLPTVSGIFSYFYEFQSNTFSNLFSTAYPYSYVGLSFNFPLFTGFSRSESVHKSKIQEQFMNWTEINLKSQIYKEYTSALANYKSSLYLLHLLNENKTLARNVYRIVTLQYQKGIVPYLNIIVAESNLIAADIGYINALFQVLSGKIDLEKATGNITVIH
jgi:outer membrane protein TolC